ncbi:DNA polymerase delta subunit 3 [Galemys pyrenaicus]|uniref:DNA polymerase delta subunit 3 n=1 Tax=Galemys pyrenaicus TaxID=202257 RepID=A0A8J6AP47_GALPY|nr:DNA polymerase delta subunit 3 [Galemys pyrenaicus]
MSLWRQVGLRGGRARRSSTMADQLYLENIDEFVTDQNKIVTYKWLSYTLGVHVNQAKQMLYDYVERKRKENSGAQLHVTYLVSGSLIQNGQSCHKVAVVREDKLEAVKSKLAVTASVHVYSIQKAMLKDSGPLFNTDYDILKSNLQNCSKFSAIQCAAAVPRAPAVSSSSGKCEQSNRQVPSEAHVSSASTANGHGPPTSKQVSQQPKGIMGMFVSKTASKTQDTNKETKTDAKEVTNASLAGSKAPGKMNMMSNFFGKAAMNKLKVNLDSEQTVKEEQIVELPPVSVTEPKLAAPAGLKKSSKKAEPVKMQQKEKKRGKQMELSDDETKETDNMKKKRRRIKLPESESSEDEVMPDSPGAYEAESPSPPPASPPPEPVPKTEPEPPSVKSSSGGNKRKRKRVLKSRTFTDDEGCMVTEKVYESESCTDSEDDFKMKVSSTHRPPAVTLKRDSREERKGAKRGAAALGKPHRQASITGFFPKK